MRQIGSARSSGKVLQMRLMIAGFVVLCGASPVVAAEKSVRFWNLTSETVTSLRLAPAGARDFGPDLAKADADGGVDHDERLPIKNLTPGTYDALIRFKSGRSCMAKGLNIETGSVFSVEEKDLSSCSK